MTRDLKSNYAFAFLTNIATQTDNTALTAKLTRVNANTTDTILLLLGTIDDADATFAATLTESDDDVTYTTVNARDYSGTLTGMKFDSDNTIRAFSYWGLKKYVKLTVTPTGNTGNLTWGAASVVGPGRVQP